MWLKKKALLIVLAVGAAIFVITWAVGQPIWQAAVFAVGFLIVAAIVGGGSGLLIPEGILHWTPPRLRGTPKEPAKDEYFKKLDDEVVILSAKRRATTEDISRLRDCTRVMKEVGELVFTVHESVKSKDRAEELRSLREVGKRLPPLIVEFRNIPEPTDDKAKQTMERQARGMDLYLEACADFAQAIENGDGDLAARAAMQITQALDFMDIIGRPSSSF